MKSFAIPLLALALVGCISGPRLPYVSTPAADLVVSAGAPEAMPRLAEVDSPTRKTNDLLAAVGADKLEGLKPMDMEGMDHSKSHQGHEAMDHPKTGPAHAGTDHSKMHGAPTSQDKHKPEETKGMDDHSKMPGMKGPGQPVPETEKKATLEEMKQLSDEMKKTSEELKKKANTPKKTPTDQPKDPHSGHGSAAPAAPKS
jgi:hypothetical protein